MLSLGIALLIASCFVGSAAYILFRHTGSKNAGLIGNVSIVGAIAGVVVLFTVKWWVALLGVAGYCIVAMFFTLFWQGVFMRRSFPRDFIENRRDEIDFIHDKPEEIARRLAQLADKGGINT
jgi:hypothetical protein